MKIMFDRQMREKYYKLLDEIFDTSMWSEGKMVKTFEDKFSIFTNLHSAVVSSGGAALTTIFDYIDVDGKDVIVPTNTFWATAVAAKRARANILYADCNKEDLSLSFSELKKRVTPNTKAVVVVHIGGHIAFEIDQIVNFCKERNIYLIEDCAHAHGATWNGRVPGGYGFAGAYSFYATKTLPTGDGGMVVSRDKNFIEWVKQYRNYGKKIVDGNVTYPIKNGYNARISEMVAALGIVQMDNLANIIDWKRELALKFDQIFEQRVRFPSGMESGYYKYIAFDYDLKEETGKVFSESDLCHIIDEKNVDMPNSLWVSKHHKCVPIWYGWHHSSKEVSGLKDHLLASKS